ncbi:MAG: 16S rRNA (guanine(527)-N(7))-methyltransferase RsmG [Acidobacteriota bacterium]|nr:MAG: 16S rRNA (guanine(527)-N(7))-methyltransferase RsmG [Acidobacteriota bacterium]
MTDNRQDKFESLLGRSPLSGEQVGLFLQFYALVLKWNDRLHLTSLTEPDEFIDRHITESLFAVPLIPETVAVVWDMGTGMGVPGIPLAILRPDLNVVLVDSSRKKAIYLEEAVSELGLSNARVLCRRIEDLEPLDSDALLTARAVERMESLLPALLRLGAACPRLLIFGGHSLAEKLRSLLDESRNMTIHTLPGSEGRLLITVDRST